jgi:hypothetical protein
MSATYTTKQDSGTLECILVDLLQLLTRDCVSTQAGSVRTNREAVPRHNQT